MPEGPWRGRGEVRPRGCRKTHKDLERKCNLDYMCSRRWRLCVCGVLNVQVALFRRKRNAKHFRRMQTGASKHALRSINRSIHICLYICMCCFVPSNYRGVYTRWLMWNDPLSAKTILQTIQARTGPPESRLKSTWTWGGGSFRSRGTGNGAANGRASLMDGCKLE